jgi:hypothetical protein
MNECYVFEAGGRRIESATLSLEDDVRRTLETAGPLRITQRFADGTSRLLFDASAKVAAPAAEPPAPAPIAEPANGAAGVKGTSDFGRNDVHDAEACARIEAQHATLNARGIHVDASQQVAASGTRMASSGYETQRARKVEHDAKLPARDAAEQLIARVRDERRHDITVTSGELAKLIVSNGVIGVRDGSAVYKIGEQAIRGICGRTDSPALSYLLGVRARMYEVKRLRDQLVAGEPREGGDAQRQIAECDRRLHDDRAKVADVLTYELARAPHEKLVLRVRMHPSDVFAVVSPGYTAADAPDVLPQVLASMPGDARATFSYDPKSTSWELRAAIWTPTPVAEQAIGEAFEGWVSYSSKDNGTGRFRGGGGVTLIRCYNASTYEATSSDVARVHRGRVREDIASMTAGALKSIDALCEAWGRTRAEEVPLPAEKITIEQAIPGFWRALLTDTRALAGVLPGRKADHADALSIAYFAERRDHDRIVRSDFAQGWTRYIQNQPTEIRREGERVIGKWLVNDRRPLRCDLDE